MLHTVTALGPEATYCKYETEKVLFTMVKLNYKAPPQQIDNCFLQFYLYYRTY